MNIAIGVACRDCEVDGGPEAMKPVGTSQDQGYEQTDYKCPACGTEVLVHITLERDDHSR